MENFKKSLLLFFAMTLVTGILYPLTVTGIGFLLFPQQVQGQYFLIAQKFESPKYFWPRPSAVDFNPMPSGGSNLSPFSEALKQVVEERRKKWRDQEKVNGKMQDHEVPEELLYASASGLDPHISPQASRYQVPRVAAARGWDPSAVQQIVDRMTESPQFGIFGEPRVNVFLLNEALDKGL